MLITIQIIDKLFISAKDAYIFILYSTLLKIRVLRQQETLKMKKVPNVF